MAGGRAYLVTAAPRTKKSPAGISPRSLNLRSIRQARSGTLRYTPWQELLMGYICHVVHYFAVVNGAVIRGSPGVSLPVRQNVSGSLADVRLVTGYSAQRSVR